MEILSSRERAISWALRGRSISERCLHIKRQHRPALVVRTTATAATGMGKLELRCLLAQVLVFHAVAHMTTVCTSTAPSNCANAEMHFFFGTYHSKPSSGSAPGSVHIQTPDGRVITTPLASVFKSQSTTPTKSGWPCPADDLRARAPASVMPSDSSITCYKATPPPAQNPTAPPQTYAVADTCEAFPSLSGSWKKSLSTYYATVAQATSGIYTVWTTGTNYRADPCTSYASNSPCGMSRNKKYVFELAVATCGASCT